MLDANRCLSYWTQAPAPIPEPYRAELGAQVYGCDICQDVCPWNRGVEKRREADVPPAGAEPHVDLVAWLEADDAELAPATTRLYVPRNDPRWLRRNALVALGNTGGPEHIEPCSSGSRATTSMLAGRSSAGRTREARRVVASSSRGAGDAARRRAAGAQSRTWARSSGGSSTTASPR